MNERLSLSKKGRLWTITAFRLTARYICGLAVPVFNDRPDYQFEIGKGIRIREGTDVTLITTGLCVSAALEAAKLLEQDGILAEVVNIHTIKPLDQELILSCAIKTKKLVTIEEHSIIGGLGGAVCECCPVPAVPLEPR